VTTDRSDFKARLARAAEEAGVLSAACLDLAAPTLKRRVEGNNRLVADWLGQGRHAGMDYLVRMFAEKASPWTTFAFARSVIVVTFTNRWGLAGAGHPFPAPRTGVPIGYMSAYARDDDYHQAGRSLLADLRDRLGITGETETAVDTGAVYERLLAAAGGLGVHGANDLLRVPGAGSRVFIGCLFVAEELPQVILDPRPPFECSACRACLEHCPTGAIDWRRPIEAGRCLSYLTIEKNGPLTPAEAESVGDWLFGCDCCTAVCPPVSDRDLRIPIDLDWLLKAPASEVRRTIRGNASAYAGVTRLRRNAVVVLSNLATRQALDLLDWVRDNSGSALVRRQIELLPCRAAGDA
jgi:epoxyqueuosine reductase